MGGRVVRGVTTVRIGRDLLGDVADGSETMIAVLTQPGAAHVSERVVANLEGRSIPVETLSLPDSEAAKSLAVVEETTAWLGEIGLKRNGIVLGVGGGALTDLAGFVASVYMRGVEARYVPTTLLGAVDAAIGGKTAVNVGGKNLVGTFAHPERVIIDIDVLERLSVDLLADGMAEVLKTGLVGDPDLVVLLERAGVAADLEEIVERSIGVKTAIVDADFRESGVRAHLNFGHTVGHAIEAVAGWSHGRSIAVGMVAAAEISRSICGFDEVERISDVLVMLGLPVAAPELSRGDLHQVMRIDKKSDSDGLRVVLLEAIGRPLVSRINMDTLDSGLDSIGIGKA